MPQTRKMNSKKKRPCTRRSAGCSPLCCTPTTPPSLHTFPARSCKPATSSFYLISFQIPSQTCDFPLDGKVSRQIKLKTKKNRSSRSCRQRLYPPAYPSRDTFLLLVLFFFFLFSPPFPSAKGTGQTSEAIQSQNSLRKFPRGGVLITTKQPCHRQHDDEKE